MGIIILFGFIIEIFDFGLSIDEKYGIQNIIFDVFPFLLGIFFIVYFTEKALKKMSKEKKEEIKKVTKKTESFFKKFAQK